ncbi:IS110 family transposase [Streptomyces sp. AcE210]|uniref:IS110 family transposase n=1 Tax=Streptomyces sp. AcE210 TaxID=2292703 RepID=UPI001F0C710E|nr:IS110 family transposase [Streptomyces sp. AcE210]
MPADASSPIPAALDQLREQPAPRPEEIPGLLERLALLGVGPVTAAHVLISWSYPGHFRSEAAFASFASAAPIPASSGLANRHRINRSGDRQLNRALHTITRSGCGWTRRQRPTSLVAWLRGRPPETHNAASSGPFAASSSSSLASFTSSDNVYR